MRGLRWIGAGYALPKSYLRGGFCCNKQPVALLRISIALTEFQTDSETGIPAVSRSPLRLKTL
jgi:hypothetical protein